MAETVSAAVQAAIAPAARYVALIVQNNPAGSSSWLLARPDVDATLTAALEQAREAAADAVRQQWAGAPPDPDLLASLLADITRQYAGLPRLRALIKAAYASVPPRAFAPGVSQPGSHPAQEAAAERAAAVRRAVLGFARAAALRSSLTVSVAETSAAAAAVLAEGQARADSGEPVSKRWVAREGACHWCAGLHGTTIGLEESFLPYLGGPADLTGHGKLTQPPKPYRGVLDFPPLHPRCRCKVVIVTDGSPSAEPLPDAVRKSPAFTAAQVRAMPEEKYRGLVAFITAAVHELGQVLRRLVARG